jgi:hypothetical protein
MVVHGVMLFMLKDKLYIHDNMFSHAKSSSWYNEPALFDWVRKYDEDYLIFTDNSLQYVDNYNNQKKYAWLLESPIITPSAYEYIKYNHNKFDLIFTFSKELLTISDKFVLIPLGGCWIDNEDMVIHEKTKNVSIILSSKKSSVGHRLRHSILKKYPNIDFFGHDNYIDKKITALKDYRFSIIIENCKEDYYFSEKLIDSFVTGTIPIYWGCPSIYKFFDTNGMLIFDTMDELEKIMSNLSEDLYLSKLESIEHNFEEAKKYLVAENIIYDKLKII